MQPIQFQTQTQKKSTTSDYEIIGPWFQQILSLQGGGPFRIECIEVKINNAAFLEIRLRNRENGNECVFVPRKQMFVLEAQQKKLTSETRKARKFLASECSKIACPPTWMFDTVVIEGDTFQDHPVPCGLDWVKVYVCCTKRAQETQPAVARWELFTRPNEHGKLNFFKREVKFV